MAAAAGVTLGPILSITEDPGPVVSPMVTYGAESAADAARPIEAGSQDLGVTVGTVFGIA